MGTITLIADPIAGFRSSMAQVLISGWEDVDPDLIQAYPCAYCYVSNVDFLVEFEQDNTVARLTTTAGVNIIHRSNNSPILEKLVYRYTDSVYRMMLNDMYISGSGWKIMSIVKDYTAVLLADDFLYKQGSVAFTVASTVVT